MKVTKEKAAEHRAAIVESAAKLFREQGMEGVGVAELTAAAGLTHGGFYRHFESKEALFSEACLRAFAEAAEVAGDVMKRPDGMRLLRNGYLADERVYGTPECPLATLGSDVARQGPEVQAVFAQGLRRQLASSGHAIGTPEWEQATANIAMLVGAMVMARSVRKVDKELAEAVVKAVKKKEDRKITKPVTRA